VIGNSKYQKVPALKNPGNDAQAVASALKDDGFLNPVTAADLEYKQINDQFDSFLKTIVPGDAALFYFSGHGAQLDGENYLIPTDFTLETAQQLPYRSFAASQVIKAFLDKGASVVIVILDACRDNPFLATKGIGGGGLAPMSGPSVLVAFAAAPGRQANDSPGLANSLFTTYLLEGMKQPGQDIVLMFRDVRNHVLQASNGTQFPFVSDGTTGVFTPHRTTVPRKNLGLDTDALFSAFAYTADLHTLGQIVTSSPEGRQADLLNHKLATLYASAINPVSIVTPARQELRSPSELDALREQADREFKKGNFTTAISSYDKILARKPGDLWAIYDRGNCHLQLKEYASAAADFNAAIISNPDYSWAHYNLGVTLQLSGDARAAIVQYTKALDLAPGYAEGYTNRAVAFSQIGDNTSAMRDVNKTLSSNATYAPALFLRSELRRLSGEETGSKKDLDGAVAASRR
jgi:tetratricopeptide (TPR) repeat protein